MTDPNQPRQPKDMKGLLRFCVEATKNEDAPDLSDPEKILNDMDPEKRKTLKTNICEDCGGAFASSSYLKSHRKFHCSVLSVEKHFSCSICPSRFTTSSLLKHHESRHSEDRPIKCTRENCDKRFKNKRDLKIHLDRHDGKFSIYQYPCRHCEKKFQTSWARTTHERLHTGEKPYSCKLCDYKCADVSNMKKHERNKHKELQQN